MQQAPTAGRVGTCRLFRTLAPAVAAALTWSFGASMVSAIDIRVDYRYDTNNFFSTQERRDALEAAADRLSGIITSNLTAVGTAGTATGTPAGWRVGFSHPGTGQDWQLSTATSAASDPIASAGAGNANDYGFAGLAADEWVLFAGGRALGGLAGVGGTGTGSNFETTAEDLLGPFHRGVISETPGSTSDTFNDLPAWGGSVSFDTATNWNFDLDSAPVGPTATDFYTIALHEIGHALGLSLRFNQWSQYVSGNDFAGPETVAAYNADNGTSLSSLEMESASNFHWEDGLYDSRIFPVANPNYVGTVGPDGLQDLLMEPVANFSPSVWRFELTNVDVAALRDLGWSTAAIPEPAGLAFLAVASLATLRRRA